jgi:hypothetical protein
MVMTMAKMTDEECERRTLQHARHAAEAAESEDRRARERRQQWQREGMYLSWAELEAGEHCRGCGQPLRDGLGNWPPLLDLTPDQRAEYDRVEELFRDRHRSCRSHRWGLDGHRTLHCGYCCPPPPLSPRQVDRLSQIFSFPRRPEDQDAWDLELTCGHTVRRTQHHDHDRYSARVVECPMCEQRRGVISAERIGPAGYSDRQVSYDRLATELSAAQAKLDKQRRATAATERKVAELTQKMEGLRS